MTILEHDDLQTGKPKMSRATYRMHRALLRALKAAKTQVRLADICGVKQPSVWYWLQNELPLPPEYVLKVEAATGVSRHALRPDIYPKEATI